MSEDARGRRRRAAVAAGLAASTLLLVACGATDAESGSGSTRSAGASPKDPTSAGADSGVTPALPTDLPSFQIPLAAYELNGANLYTMQVTQFQFANECMARFGFPVVTPPLDREQMIAEQKESDARLYGIDSASEAKAYGYMPQVIPGASQAGAMPSQSASYEYVFLGNKDGSLAPPPGGYASPGKFGGLTIPPGGCLGEARTKLWGSPDAQVKDQLAQGLRIAAYNQAEADPRVQALFARWSTCMAKQGFQYQTPLEPKFSRPDGSTPSAVEVNTAVADVACKEETDLVDGWNKVDIEYQQRAIEKNQLALTEEQDKIKAALEKATAVLNGH